MAWRRYPFGYVARDFDDVVNEAERRIQEMAGMRFLPPGGIADRFLPAIRGEFRVDVREHGDEVLVVADLPGVEKDDVQLGLVNPRTLEIRCERKTGNDEKDEGYFVRERQYGSMTRTVALPDDVTEEGASASFKNGVLEVRLKKVSIDRGTRIRID
ncbi:MAG: Hsp20/alpha crystallin family protein [Methanoregulaceae archaeon]|nr:Hsp20/alpha crystallin family protein [Methanoregulaceae archaeon]